MPAQPTAPFLTACLLGAGLALIPLLASCTDQAPGPARESHPSEQPLDLARPVPREQVLELFRRLFALPAEDYLNWDESVAAGKIPQDVQAFHEHLLAFNKEAQLDPEEISTDDLPFIKIPGGPVVYPVLLPTLGPILGANVTQEDLNALLPELADAQRRVWELGARHEEEELALFTGVRLAPDDFVIARIHPEPSPGTIAVQTGPDPEHDLLQIDRAPALDGTHIQGARITNEPFVSLHLQLTEEGSERFFDFTSDNIGQMVAVLIGGEVRATVPIVVPVRARKLQLPGQISEEEARGLLEGWSAGASATP